MFVWTERDARQTRAYTNRLIEMAEEGMISWEMLATDLLGWMSEDEVREFAQRNDLISNPDDVEENDDE